jgi:hypothetical protein
MDTTVKVIDLGGVSASIALAKSMTAGAAVEAVFKGGNIEESKTPAKEVNGEMTQYRFAHIPMEIAVPKVGGGTEKKIVKVVANGRFNEAANKPANNTKYTVQVDHREYTDKNGNPKVNYSFQMVD